MSTRIVPPLHQARRRSKRRILRAPFSHLFLRSRRSPGELPRGQILPQIKLGSVFDESALRNGLVPNRQLLRWDYFRVAVIQLNPLTYLTKPNDHLLTPTRRYPYLGTTTDSALHQGCATPGGYGPFEVSQGMTCPSSAARRTSSGVNGVSGSPGRTLRARRKFSKP